MERNWQKLTVMLIFFLIKCSHGALWWKQEQQSAWRESPFPHSSLPLTWMFENIHGWSPTVPSHLVLHRPSLDGCFWSLWQSFRCSPHIAFLQRTQCRLLFLKDLDMILRSSPAGRHCPWCLWVHVQLSVTRHCLVYRHFADMCHCFCHKTYLC